MKGNKMYANCENLQKDEISLEKTKNIHLTG